MADRDEENPSLLTARSVNYFWAPAGTTLKPNTTYFVVTRRTDDIATQSLGHAVTTSANEDSGTASGWSIGNSRFRRNSIDDSWVEQSNRAVQIRVHGTTIDPAATGHPEISGVTRIGETLTANIGTIADHTTACRTASPATTPCSGSGSTARPKRTSPGRPPAHTRSRSLRRTSQLGTPGPAHPRSESGTGAVQLGRVPDPSGRAAQAGKPSRPAERARAVRLGAGARAGRRIGGGGMNEARGGVAEARRPPHFICVGLFSCLESVGTLSRQDQISPTQPCVR